MKTEMKSTIFLILMFIAIICLIICMIFLVKYKNIYYNDPMNFTMNQYKFDVCTCYSNGKIYNFGKFNISGLNITDSYNP